MDLFAKNDVVYRRAATPSWLTDGQNGQSFICTARFAFLVYVVVYAVPCMSNFTRGRTGPNRESWSDGVCDDLLERNVSFWNTFRKKVCSSYQGSWEKFRLEVWGWWRCFCELFVAIPGHEVSSNCKPPPQRHQTSCFQPFLRNPGSYTLILLGRETVKQDVTAHKSNTPQNQATTLRILDMNVWILKSSGTCSSSRMVMITCHAHISKILGIFWDFNLTLPFDLWFDMKEKKNILSECSTFGRTKQPFDHVKILNTPKRCHRWKCHGTMTTLCTLLYVEYSLKSSSKYPDNMPYARYVFICCLCHVLCSLIVNWSLCSCRLLWKKENISVEENQVTLQL